MLTCMFFFCFVYMTYTPWQIYILIKNELTITCLIRNIGHLMNSFQLLLVELVCPQGYII